MDAIAHISAPVEPRTGMFSPSRPRAEEAEAPPEDAAMRPGLPEPFRAPEPIRRKFQARLNYDPLEADVFVEILDPETGDVLRRLPAEKASGDDAGNSSGTILNRLA